MLTTIRAWLLRERVQPFAVAFVVFGVYLLTGPRTNPYNHYVLQADAFLQGRLDLVDPAPYLEVALSGGRAYVINPPAPTLFLLPFVAAFGTGVNQVPISAAVGAAAAGVFWVAARRLWDDPALRLGMVTLFVFGTNYWWAASDGGTWTYAHTCAVLFCSCALVEALGRRRPWLVGLLVGLGGLSRLPVFLTFPLFAYLVVRDIPDRSGEAEADGDTLRRRAMYTRIAAFAFPLAACIAFDLVFNDVRYGTFSDSGYADEMYLRFSWFRNYGMTSLAHVPRHLYAIFFAVPVFSEGFPFLRPSRLGMGLFFTTPAFLYAFRASLNARTIAALASVAGGAAAILTYWATGWGQFGYRFSLDVYIPLLLLAASGMGERLDYRKAAVIALSCAIAAWGVLTFSVFRSAV